MTLPGQIIPSDLVPSEVASEREFQLWIAGENWTPYAREVRFTNSGGEGASIVNFEARRPMDGYEDAVVELWLAKARAGYLRNSDFRLYFAGTLNRPYPDSPWPGATAQALGPFAAMASQNLGEDILYNGKTLAYSLNDVARRAYTVSGLVEVVGGHDITVEKAEFAQEVTLAEAARGLCDPVGYRMTDARGLKRLFFPEPQPGATGKSRAIYGPQDYAPGDCKISDVHSSSYFKVVVFRRSEWGVYEVIESALVEPQRVPKPRGVMYKKRIFYIGDFPGTSAQAKDTAHKQAHKLAVGEYDLEGLTVPFDPGIYRFDQITVWRERERQDGIWRETFDFVTDGGCDIDLSDDTMTLKGFGVMTDEEWVRPVRIVVRRANPAVIVAPFDYPSNPQDSILVGDLISVTGSRTLGLNDAVSVADTRNAIKNTPAVITRPITDSVTVGDTRVLTMEEFFPITASANDAYVGYGANTYPPTTSGVPYSGNSGTDVNIQRSHNVAWNETYRVWNGLMRFDTSSLPDGATVVDCLVYFTMLEASNNTNSLGIMAEWFNGWDGAINVSRDYTNVVSGTAITGEVSLSGFSTAGVGHALRCFNPTNVNKTGFTGLRWSITERAGGLPPTGLNRMRISSFDHATHEAPMLWVKYTV